jgi:predicted transcriptional regulator
MRKDIITKGSVRKLHPGVIGQRLRRAGLSQWDIAQRVGCSQSFVSGVINRRQRYNPEQIEKVWQELEKVLSNGPQRAA